MRIRSRNLYRQKRIHYLVFVNKSIILELDPIFYKRAQGGGIIFFFGEIFKTVRLHCWKNTEVETVDSSLIQNSFWNNSLSIDSDTDTERNGSDVKSNKQLTDIYRSDSDN